jgi:hypothetical protein
MVPIRRKSLGVAPARSSTASAAGVIATECLECGDRPPTVKVNFNGLPCPPVLCERCHEKLLARSWRADIWLRTME